VWLLTDCSVMDHNPPYVSSVDMDLHQGAADICILSSDDW